MVRTQINFRLDTELLAAIKARCEADNITITDFLVDAARSALGIETTERTTLPNSEAVESLEERLAVVEGYLAQCLSSQERIGRIELRVEEVLGEIAA